MKDIDLICAMAEESDLSKLDADYTLNAFIKIVTKELKNKGKVKLAGFGTFETYERHNRNGKNSIVIIPKFRPSKALKDLVNGTRKK